MAPLQGEAAQYANMMQPLQAYNSLLGGQMGMQGQQYQAGANNANMQNQFWGSALGAGSASWTAPSIWAST